MVRADGKSVRRLHDRGAEPVRERGCEDGAPEEGDGASQGEGSGRDVESRNDHGRSLWPTAKRFSPPPNKTHPAIPRLRWPGATFPLIFPGGSHFSTPSRSDSLGVGKRSRCAFRPQRCTISGVRDAVSIRERAAHRRGIRSPVQRLRHAHREARRLDPARHPIAVQAAPSGKGYYVSSKPCLPAMPSIPHGRHCPGTGLTGIGTST